MKMTLLAFILVFGSFFLHAQNWAPTGARWYYHQISMTGPEVYWKGLESVGDSIIMGESCKVLDEFGDYPMSFYYNCIYLMPGNAWTIVMDTDSLTVLVDSVDVITVNNVPLRVQYISEPGYPNNYYTFFGNRIIELVGNDHFSIPRR